jgi:hypothetical protein
LQEGTVYAVEFSHRSGRDLLGMAKKRSNIVPIVDDARHPHKYSMMVSGDWENAQITINGIHVCQYGGHRFEPCGDSVDLFAPGGVAMMANDKILHYKNSTNFCHRKKRPRKAPQNGL